MNKIHSIPNFMVASAVALVMASTVFGAWNTNMSYLKYEITCEFYNCAYTISQSSSGCPASTSMFPMGNCTSTEKLTTAQEVNDEFAYIISTIVDANPQGVSIRLGSDIDLGGFGDNTAEGECDAQAVPLKLNVNTLFDGGSDKGFKVRNFCYSADIKEGAMTEPVGLISSLNRGEIKNVSMENVRILVKDSRMIRDASEAGAEYYPVGAVVGAMYMASIRNASVENAFIEAPMAGGVAGFVSNSTIAGVVTTGEISVSNKLELTSTNPAITGAYAGSAISSDWQKYVSDYTVFLGGVVGMAVKDSIVNVNVTANVSDLSSEATPSALGGIAGVWAGGYMEYGFVNDTVSNISLFGGLSMGGFVGDFNSTYDGREFSDVNIFKSAVKNLEIVGSSSKDLFVGGFVGKANLATGYSLAIDSVSSDVDIKNTFMGSNTSNYYAGAYIGKTNDCTDRKVDLSITNASAAGSISMLSSEGTASNGVVNANVGGVVGSACFAKGENVLTGITSSVKISSRLESSGGVSNIGGFVGKADMFSSEKAFNVSNGRFDGSITIKNKADKINVGGIFGFYKNARSTKVSFTSLVVENSTENLMTFETANLATKGAVIHAGGVCGSCGDIEKISQVSVVGNIVLDDDDYAGDSLVVGGFVGSTTSNFSIDVRDNYMIGAIDVPQASREKKSTKIGYLMGFAYLASDQYEHNFVSNYHFSDTDKGYLDAFGYLSNGGEITGSWKNITDTKLAKVWTLSHNVRNGSTESLIGSGNGTMTDASMQTSTFADFLNEDHKKLIWNFVDGRNDNLPFLDASNAPKMYTITFKYKKWNENLKEFSDFSYDTLVVTHTKALEPALTDAEKNIPRHQFLGWDRSFTDVSADMVVNALYRDLVEVKFTSDGKTVKDTLIESGSKLVYRDTPSKAATAKYTYTFNKWDPYFDQGLNVTKDAEYKAIFDSTLNKYRVIFQSESSTIQEGDFAYGTWPTCSSIPEKPATMKYTYVFKEWSPKIDTVRSNITYKAVYDSNAVMYDITFKNGDKILSVASFEYEETPAYKGETPTKADDAQYTYTFSGWSPTIGPVWGATTYVAQFTSSLRVFNVTFADAAGNILKVEKVEYGKSATEPNVYVPEGYELAWSKDFSEITSDIVVRAVFHKIPGSSSSSDPGSSSSSDPGSSSNSDPGSSSSYDPGSSSSELPPAGETELGLVDSKVEMSGNAIRLTFGTNSAYKEIKTGARVQVIGDAGVIIDTVLTDSITDFDAVTEWVLAPAPLGKYEVALSLFNVVDTVRFTDAFEVKNEIEVQPRSWQMVSLAALDLETSYDEEDAAFYWWDELNPIGDYWQYRSYNLDDKMDASRGFWYGTQNGNPLILKEETPTKDAEITWELNCKYSGWNLVANPHGWNVDLTEGEGGKVDFWRWNSQIGDYEVATMLGPYEAVWAKVSEPTTWTVSSKPMFDLKKSVDPNSVAAKRASVNGEWSLRVTLADQNGKQDSWNFLGVGSASSMDEPPAGMGDRVNLTILEGQKRLAKSVKTVGSDMQWTLSVNASSARDGFLRFEGIEDLAASGLHLFVTADNKTTEVMAGESVKVGLKENSKQVTVRVAKSASVVASNNLKGFRTELAQGYLNVNFDAPQNLAGANARVELVSLKGEIVASQNFVAMAGFNGVSLKVAKNGLYFVRVKVASQVATGKVMVK
ncbi:MAG: T9SS type A sorting domain-containing protein [Fibrobacter sp.]|nr:T9SS type A sorting domain-containing protein [Fibrobacter sp.]